MYESHLKAMKKRVDTFNSTDIKPVHVKKRRKKMHGFEIRDRICRTL